MSDEEVAQAKPDVPLHDGWLKLRQRDNRLFVFVWATDVEMVADEDIGSIVYLHHDKIAVQEHAEWVVRAVDKISRNFEALEGKT